MLLTANLLVDTEIASNHILTVPPVFLMLVLPPKPEKNKCTNQFFLHIQALEKHFSTSPCRISMNNIFLYSVVGILDQRDIRCLSLNISSSVECYPGSHVLFQFNKHSIPSGETNKHKKRGSRYKS